MGRGIGYRESPRRFSGGRDRISAPGRRNVTGVSVEDNEGVDGMTREYFFVSDLHIGGDEQLKILDFEEEFVEFLKSLETREKRHRARNYRGRVRALGVHDR